MTVTTKIANYGLTFNGTIQAILINCSAGAPYTVQQYTGQSIGGVPANYTFSNSGITVPSGTYVLCVQHQPGGTGAPIVTGSDFYENPIIINVIASADVNSPSLNADIITIYPNPATENLYINPQGVSINEIRISDVQGREIKMLVPLGNQSEINVPLSDIVPGMYFIQMRSGTTVITRKVVITK